MKRLRFDKLAITMAFNKGFMNVDPKNNPPDPPVPVCNPGIPNNGGNYIPINIPLPITVSPTYPVHYINIPMGGWWGLNGDLSGNAPPPKKKKDSDGCTCKKCKNFYQYAEPNQKDGTLICYGCRIGW